MTTVGGARVRLVGLVHVYRVLGTDVAALRGVDLDVDPGERVALLGPSGSGKSTLLSLLAGLRRPSAGSVLVDGADVATFDERRLGRYRAETGLMLQGAASTLLPYATPAQCVRFAAGTKIAADPVLAGADLISERRPTAQLDRAERQLTALAVAMAREPRLLLLDEPTSGLGDDERDAFFDALLAATDRSGTTVVVVTHDEEVAGRMQRMVRMRDGRIGAEGLRHQQYAVIGTDGSIQLPEALAAGWPAGAQVRVEQVGDTLQIRHRETGEDR